jgi:hypothetical protein
VTPARTPAFILAVLTAGVLAAAVACDDKNPVAPSGPPPPTVQTLAIGGLQSLQHPGEVLQLSATGTFSDGSTRDVTADVLWTSGDARVVTIRSGGQLTATGYGSTDITAVHRTGGQSARASARVMPEGMFLVTGRVTGEGHFELPGVAVSVTLPDATVIRTTTDEAGIFRLPGRGDVVLRAEKAGYSPEEKPAVVENDVDVSFELDRLQDSGSIAGSYTLVFTASASCKLPAEVLRRQYTARIYEPESLWVELGGADMEAWGSAGFTGTRAGSTVHFDIYDGYSLDLGNDLVFVERLDPGRNLAFSGVATGAIEEEAILATFNGRVQLRSVGFPPAVFAECRAADHRLEFVRAEPPGLR